jgi:hypothetical protein
MFPTILNGLDFKLVIYVLQIEIFMTELEDVEKKKVDSDASDNVIAETELYSDTQFLASRNSRKFKRSRWLAALAR